MSSADQITNVTVMRQLQRLLEAREASEKIRNAEKKTMEADIVNLRKDIAKLCLEVKDMKMPKSVRFADDVLYDRETYRFFTYKLKNFDGVNFCVEPDLHHGYSEIYLDSEEFSDCKFKRSDSYMIYSVSGHVIYNKSMDEAMLILGEAKKKGVPVIIGLYETWKNHEKAMLQLQEEELVRIKAEKDRKILDYCAGFSLIALVGCLLISLTD